ncbi:MAG: DUF4019 domain-containing protein [Parachlamydiaceae bacterium]|nr:DUF4019 domain-containing protein [Parachlamydiaceae bacterium]
MAYKSLFFSLVLSFASAVDLSAQGQGQVLEAPKVYATPTPALQKSVDDSLTAGRAWLKLLDQGNYGGSWETATKFIQYTLSREEWIQSMDILRKPLGSMTDRTLVDMRVAMDPPNAPQGEYMILVFDTKFSSGNTAKELLTMQEHEGVWRLYTYSLAADK